MQLTAKVEMDFEDVKRLVIKEVEVRMPGFKVEDIAFRVSKKRIGGEGGTRGTKGSHEVVVVDKVEATVKQVS